MITIAQCSRCGCDHFPVPLMCANCGSAEFIPAEVAEATIEQITRVENPQPAILASVRVSPELVVIAALQGDACGELGVRIPLSHTPGTNGTAYVPSHELMQG